MRRERGTRDTGDVRLAQECYVVIEDVEDRQSDKTEGGPRVIRGRIKRIRRKHALAFVEEAPPAPEPVGRPARVARMLALAHRLQDAIDRGEYEGRSDLARTLGVTRARVTQLLDLTLLAPEIQEALLAMDVQSAVRHHVDEQAMWSVARRLSWHEQRAAWKHTRPSRHGDERDRT